LHERPNSSTTKISVIETTEIILSFNFWCPAVAVSCSTCNNANRIKLFSWLTLTYTNRTQTSHTLLEYSSCTAYRTLSLSARACKHLSCMECSLWRLFVKSACRRLSQYTRHTTLFQYASVMLRYVMATCTVFALFSSMPMWPPPRGAVYGRTWQWKWTGDLSLICRQCFWDASVFFRCLTPWN
jgi:hypothetical protein